VTNTYRVVFLVCFSSSCVPYVASFSGLSICDCPIRYSLTFVLLIVFSLLKLQLLNKQNKIYVFSIIRPVNKIR
jgi:uncharacterized membrane protein